MKRLFVCFLAVCLMAGCSSKAQTPATIPSHESVPSGTEEPQANVALDYDTQFIRTEGGDDFTFPGVQIIHSKQELDDYYTTYREVYDLERADTAYPDTIGFLDACDKYDAAFFEESYLIFVILEESSGSVRHNVHRVEQTPEGKIEIAVDSVLPGGFGTEDMGHWHVMLELSKDAEIESPNDVALYWNGALAWKGAAVVTPVTDSNQEPLQGIIGCGVVHGNLRLGGYSWNYRKGVKTHTVTADQSSRPIDKLKPITIPDKYAQSVYMPIPGSEESQPTNMVGYRVHLGWDSYPSTMSITCWPDTVLEDSSTAAEEVVCDDMTFYAKPGGYIYEITATWNETYDLPYYGTATYYVYIVGGHDHQNAQQPQTVDDPITGYCGNTQTTLYIDGEAYPFIYGHSVTLTDILVNLDYDPEKVCKCLPQYTVDTEFGSYGISLSESYARCEKGQADLTQEQVETIKEIIDWATATTDIS